MGGSWITFQSLWLITILNFAAIGSFNNIWKLQLGNRYPFSFFISKDPWMYKNIFSWLCMGLILCAKSQASLAEYFLLYWKRFQSFFKTIPALVTFGWIAAAGDYGGSYTKELDCSGLCIELDCDGSETWAWEPSLQICKLSDYFGFILQNSLFRLV